MRYTTTLLLFVHLALTAQVSIQKINKSSNNPNEPTIAINPNNPFNIVAAANNDNYYFTENGGIDWVETTATSRLGNYGDPVLHFTDKNLFFTHLSQTPGKDYGDWFDRIVVQKIIKNEPWTEKSYSVGYNDPKMQDKPWLSSFKENVYVSWTEFDHYEKSDPEYRSRIRFSAYDPKKDEFSTAITISDITGDCNDGDSTLEGATTGVGPKGEIYCVWSGFSKLYFDKSLDGGKTWGEDKIIGDQPKGWNMEMPNIFRANGMPFVKCDRKKDIIYVCWADEYSGNADVWLIYSKDKGETWTDRIRLNNDSTSSHQYFPNLDIDEKTGNVYAAFYDQRHSSLNAFYDIYVAEFSIADGVKNYRMTPKSIALPGKSYFYGDYLDIDVVNGALAVVFTSFEPEEKSSIQVAYSPNIENLTIPIQKETQLATLTESDRTKLVVNVQAPYVLRGKIRVGHFFSNRTYLLRESHRDGNIDFDEIIGIYKTDFMTRIKYTITNLETGVKTKYKGKLSNFF